MKKLLYITNGIKGAGGLERVLAIKASYLAENLDYEVHILTLNHNDSDIFYDFSPKIILHDIAVFGNPIQYIKKYITGIKKVVQEINPDVISVCDDGLKGFFLPKILSKKQPIIYERHASIELHLNTIKGKITKFIMRKLSVDFDKFIVLTSSNTKEWPKTSAISIPNPLSFYPLESSNLDSKKVIVIGSQSYNKGYDLILEAWEKVQAKNIGWQLHTYGKKSQSIDFEKMAKDLKVNNSVFFNDAVKDIKSKYLGSSILVLPSRSEGFGMVIIEAMACGVPCVSFDCPSGPRDIIIDGVDGFLIPPLNVNLLAEKITFLIENDAIRKEMGKRAKENVKRYLPETIVGQWDQLFKDLLK
jgi:glycosyltransferase involved in cell wall biosynthesis